MKKYLIGLVLVLVFAFYAVFKNQNQNPVAVLPPSQAPGSTPPSQSTSTPQGNPQSQYKDGTYTGSTADAIYGKIRVAAVIRGGQLTGVKLLQYPDAAGHTSEVSSMSLPQLIQEAIQSQDANVNAISGATQTSQGFQQSLASALAQART